MRNLMWSVIASVVLVGGLSLVTTTGVNKSGDRINNVGVFDTHESAIGVQRLPEFHRRDRASSGLERSRP